jgi:Serine acetyltransferase
MRIRDILIDYSTGDGLRRFWRLFRRRERTISGIYRSILTFRLCCIARRRGGYIGPGASFADVPFMPHGLHGVYISRYAQIGIDCRIYQSVTIGEVNGKAPKIGDHCLIGAGAVIIGDIQVGSNVKIGAGTVVSQTIPPNCTVVAQPPRIIERAES